MIEVEVEATVTYVCELSDEDSELVKQYAEENGMGLVDAVEELYSQCKINLYQSSIESDFSTENFLSATEEDD